MKVCNLKHIHPARMNGIAACSLPSAWMMQVAAGFHSGDIVECKIPIRIGEFNFSKGRRLKVHHLEPHGPVYLMNPETDELHEPAVLLDDIVLARA